MDAPPTVDLTMAATTSPFVLMDRRMVVCIVVREDSWVALGSLLGYTLNRVGLSTEWRLPSGMW